MGKICVLTAIMSTADSQLLTASSSVSQNLLNDFFYIRMGQKSTVLLPAFVVALAVNAAVSLLTSAPGKDVTDTFEAVNRT